jgi:hypothetical protein
MVLVLTMMLLLTHLEGVVEVGLKVLRAVRLLASWVLPLPLPSPLHLSWLLLEVETTVVPALSELALPLWPFPWLLLLLLLLERLEVVVGLAVDLGRRECYCSQQGPNPRARSDLSPCQRPVVNFSS